MLWLVLPVDLALAKPWILVEASLHHSVLLVIANVLFGQVILSFSEPLDVSIIISENWDLGCSDPLDFSTITHCTQMVIGVSKGVISEPFA